MPLPELVVLAVLVGCTTAAICCVISNCLPIRQRRRGSPPAYAPPLVTHGESWEPDQRAWHLLKRFLTGHQLGELRKYAYFHVDGKRYIYRIGRRSGTGVSLLRWPRDKGIKYAETGCVQTIALLPENDRLLLMKLWIEADEKKFSRITNWS